MKFLPISDIHNEFEVFNTSCWSNHKDVTLVIAGDFFVAGRWGTLRAIMGHFAGKFRNIVFVLGNHDLWGGSIITTHDRCKQELSCYPNVHVLENQSVIIDDVAFVGATFWTDYFGGNPLAKLDAQSLMGDFKRIRSGTKETPYSRKLYVNEIEIAHSQSRYFFENEVKRCKQLGLKVVVVSHHAPSALSRWTYANPCDNANPCYYSFLEGWVEQLSPEYWVHGHVHESKRYQLGTTTVIANPYGYAPNDVNEEFDHQLIIEL